MTICLPHDATSSAPIAMKPSSGLALLPLIASAACFLVGCGEADPLNRQSVSGSVTLDGQPLKQGAISFSPAAGGETGGGAAIAGGSYTMSREHGLPPGKYVVRINSAEGGSADPNEPPGDVAPAKELVPASWNTKSKHEIEVVEGQNDFPFDLKSSD